MGDPTGLRGSRACRPAHLADALVRVSAVCFPTVFSRAPLSEGAGRQPRDRLSAGAVGDRHPGEG